MGESPCAAVFPAENTAGRNRIVSGVFFYRMRQVPALLVMGIVAGFTGAGITWLVMREPGASPVHQENRKAESPRTEPNRERDPRSVRPAETPEPPGSAERANPEALRALAAKTVAVSQMEKDRDFSLPDRRDPRPSSSATIVSADPTPGNGSPAASGNSPGKRQVSVEELQPAHAAALAASAPYVKEGFVVRDDYWGGLLGNAPRAVTHQLFRGNEYWFWLGTDTASAGIDLEAYDADGNRAHSDHWQSKYAAAVRVIPGDSGKYYLVISRKTQTADAQRDTRWALIYGYR